MKKLLISDNRVTKKGEDCIEYVTIDTIFFYAQCLMLYTTIPQTIRENNTIHHALHGILHSVVTLFWVEDNPAQLSLFIQFPMPIFFDKNVSMLMIYKCISIILKNDHKMGEHVKT